MNDNEITDLRKKLFSDVEEKTEPEEDRVSIDDIFEGKEAPPESSRETPPTPPVAPAPPEEEEPKTEEERATLNLRQIRKLIAAYRYHLAEAERRVNELRMKLAGLDTEYKALVGESPLPPPPAPEPAPASPAEAPAPSPAPRHPQASPPAGRARRAESPWEDAGDIQLEEAAWRILIEMGKSMPLWRIASAIRRKGFPGAFSESTLDTEVKKSGRLGFTGQGHVYLK